MQTDASDAGVGVVLLQEEDGVKKPVFYASQKLKSHQLSYSTIEKECYAIVWAVQKFQIYMEKSSCWRPTTTRWFILATPRFNEVGIVIATIQIPDCRN